MTTGPRKKGGFQKGHTPWNASNGKGWTDSQGYCFVYVTDERGLRRAKRVHRLVMEEHLGRKLEPWELVHHKDGNPSNNDISNLELMEFGQHTSEHNLGVRRRYEVRQNLQAFATMREALNRERKIKAVMLEALMNLLGQFDQAHDALGVERSPSAQAAIAAAKSALRQAGVEG